MDGGPWGTKPAKVLNHLDFLSRPEGGEGSGPGRGNLAEPTGFHAGGSRLKSAEECWPVGKACKELTF